MCSGMSGNWSARCRRSPSAGTGRDGPGCARSTQAWQYRAVTVAGSMSQPDEVTDEVTDRVPGPQPQAGGDPLAPYDAVLLLSFGGPEAPDEVMPFLENVTRGRGIGPDRLGAV